MLQKIKEYYPYYLTLHQNHVCRLLHLIGQIFTWSYVAYCLSKGYYLTLIFAPFIVYPFAWAGHLYFEKNKPAAWKSPLIAKICDIIMCFDILRGKIPLWKK